MIRDIDFFTADSPASRPIADATHQIETIRFIITRITLDSGVVGWSSLLAFDYSPHAIVGALRDVAPLAIGLQAHETGIFNQLARKNFEYFGNVGLNQWAAGAINIAMWDAWGKTLGQPIWKLFGSTRSEVPLYGSGGWLNYTMEELVGEATGYARRGFRAIKIKVGSPSLDADIERLRKVREAVGPHIQIMMDANQGMSVPSALALARKVSDLDIHWFEEPIPRTDFDGYAQIRHQAGIAVAMGEREFDLVGLRELLRRNALDLWQPDILRLGGVEGWRQSAHLAQAFGVPTLPHYYKEYDVPLLCTIPNAFGAESFDWIDGLVDNPIVVHEGMAHPLEGAGWGFEFREECLREIHSRGAND